jgi:hypothetical protein
MTKQPAKTEKVQMQTPSRMLPEVKPGHCEVDSEGFATRSILVRLPPGMIADDLRYPGIWRRVQADRLRSLRKMDRLLILSHDESWYAEAFVVNATATECKLMLMKKGSFREADQALYSDGTLEIYWSGKGYGVRRVEDQVPVLHQVYQTEKQAQSALMGWYTKEPA